MNTQATETVGATGTAPTADKATRTKGNYDIIKGHLMEVMKKNPGVTLNGLNEKIGEKSPADTPNRMQFTQIYAGIGQLKDAGLVFVTGAKKNQGLYLTKEDAEKNTPAPVARATGKKNKPFTLEKHMGEKGWKVIDGQDEKKDVLDAFKTATMVPGVVFRVMDNTGTEPKVIKTNEEPAPKAEKPAAAPKADKEPAKA